MSIETHQIRHRQSSSDMVVSRCVNVSNGLGDERIMVHSTTMCGASLGFHCLWFRQRSNSVIEFKTTAVVSKSSQDICKNDRELDELPWMTLLSSRPESSVCGLFGHYTTPKDLWLNGDCYNLSMDCDRLDNFKLVAFRCQTGEAYEVTHYTCHGTWREDATMFIYTKETSNLANNQTNQNQPECFMLREDSDGNIFFADLGSKQCDRDFDFTENGNKVMVLAQQQNCRSMTNSDQVRKRIKTLERPFSDSHSNLTMNDSLQSSAPNKSIPLILFTIFVLLSNI